MLFRESDPNWDLDIGNDVKDESQKYGQVVHHYVDKASKVGIMSFEAVGLYLVLSVSHLTAC